MKNKASYVSNSSNKQEIVGLFKQKKIGGNKTNFLSRNNND